MNASANTHTHTLARMHTQPAMPDLFSLSHNRQKRLSAPLVMSSDSELVVARQVCWDRGHHKVPKLDVCACVVTLFSSGNCDPENCDPWQQQGFQTLHVCPLNLGVWQPVLGAAAGITRGIVIKKRALESADYCGMMETSNQFYDQALNRLLMDVWYSRSMPGGTIRSGTINFLLSGHGSCCWEIGDVTLGFILYWERCCCKRQALMTLGQCLSPLKPQSPCLNTCRLVSLAWCGGVDLHFIAENAAIPNLSMEMSVSFPTCQ